jgi:hypothetical protein
MNPEPTHPGPADDLITPVFLARDAAAGAGPAADAEPRTYYVLAANGLFLVRNHAFFRSSVPAPSFPSELAEHREAFEPRFPRIPQALFERIVGFFSAVAEAYGAEAGVLLYWDPAARELHAIPPPQIATITRGYRSRGQPVGLHYEIPRWVPPTWLLVGDVHSHAQLAAFASSTDQDDEHHYPGLHVVVGEIHREPPSFHVEAVIDERRFPLALADVVEGYERRAEHFPPKWLRRLRVVDAWEYKRLCELPEGTDRGVEHAPEAGVDGVAGVDVEDVEDVGPIARGDDVRPPSGGAHENGSAGTGA